MGSRHVNIRDSHVSFLSVTPSEKTWFHSV